MRLKGLTFLLLLCFQCSLLHAQLKVTLVVNKIPTAKESDIHLFAAGDFNNWNPSDAGSELKKQSDGSWQVSGTLPVGIYNFKITRGNWQTVECTADGKSIDNRVFTLSHDTTIRMNVAGWQDNFKQEEKKHTASANVHIVTEKFDMPQLGRQRRIWIYLPADYESSHKKYPVIYMHDGQNLFDAYTSSFGEWGLDEIMDKLPAKDQCIIVGIDHGGEYRMSEYNPYNSKYGNGQGDKYIDFLAQTLKPYIDQHYRTKTDPKHTTIAGSSMGGLISYYAVLKHPEVFGSGGIFSPAFWTAPDIYNYAEQHINKTSRFYFVCGDSESDSMAIDMDKMVKLVRSKGISEQNSPETVVKGAQHNEKQWNGDFPGFYKWLIGKR
ncbi:MAG: alpha/beta hydrolase [Mucilaginibacter sp.]|nr:alpha/beta hydrolase [Mucilaginibacter sp.]